MNDTTGAKDMTATATMYDLGTKNLRLVGGRDILYLAASHVLHAMGRGVPPDAPFPLPLTGERWRLDLTEVTPAEEEAVRGVLADERFSGLVQVDELPSGRCGSRRAELDRRNRFTLSRKVVYGYLGVDGDKMPLGWTHEASNVELATGRDGDGPALLLPALRVRASGVANRVQVLCPCCKKKWVRFGCLRQHAGTPACNRLAAGG